MKGVAGSNVRNDFILVIWIVKTPNEKDKMAPCGSLHLRLKHRTTTLYSRALAPSAYSSSSSSSLSLSLPSVLLVKNEKLNKRRKKNR
jgi:hypothetical protein